MSSFFGFLRSVPVLLVGLVASPFALVALVFELIFQFFSWFFGLVLAFVARGLKSPVTFSNGTRPVEFVEKDRGFFAFFARFFAFLAAFCRDAEVRAAFFARFTFPRRAESRAC